MYGHKLEQAIIFIGCPWRFLDRRRERVQPPLIEVNNKDQPETKAKKAFYKVPTFRQDLLLRPGT